MVHEDYFDYAALPSYELDPSGSLSSMDVLIRTDPAPDPRTVAHSDEELSARNIYAIATQVLTETLFGAEDRRLQYGLLFLAPLFGFCI